MANGAHGGQVAAAAPGGGQAVTVDTMTHGQAFGLVAQLVAPAPVQLGQAELVLKAMELLEGAATKADQAAADRVEIRENAAKARKVSARLNGKRGKK